MDHGHIAHLHAQADHEDLALAYDNLLYSCPENKRAEPQTCGHAQGRKELPISPLDADCETRFAYTATGSIIPRIEDDEEAMETIRILNLDDRRSVLRKLRAEAFQVIDEFRQMITPDEFTLWIGEHLKRQPDGTFRPFWTTRKYAAGLYF